MSEKTLADKLYDSYLNYLTTDEDVFEILVETFGYNVDDIDEWPFDRFSHDYYDYSFELHDVKVGWEPTKLQLEQCWNLGFFRCWLNYKDGTEKYYYKDSNKKINNGNRIN